MALSNKQLAFVEHYLICWNATDAAKRAGYSEKSARTNGPRMLSNAVIGEAIKARLADLHMTANEVLTGLSRHARGTMKPFIQQLEGTKEVYLDLTTPEAQANIGLVRKIKTKERKGGKEDAPWREVETEIELYDAQAALVHMGRYHALFTDKVKEESWQSELIDALKAGKVTPAEVVKELGSELAAPILVAAGLRADEGGETAGSETTDVSVPGGEQEDADVPRPGSDSGGAGRDGQDAGVSDLSGQSSATV